MSTKLDRAKALNVPIASPECFVQLAAANGPTRSVVDRHYTRAQVTRALADGFFSAISHQEHRLDDHLARLVTIYERQGRRYANVWRVTRDVLALAPDLMPIQFICAYEGLHQALRAEGYVGA